LELLISQDLPLVLRVLEIVGLDVLPHLAYHLGAGQWGRADHSRQFIRGLQWLHQSRVRLLGCRCSGVVCH
jgi:hypothetical protein